MATIINNQDFTLTIAQQNAVNNAAANMGLDTVIAGEIDNDYDYENPTVPFYYESEDESGELIEEFAFNLDLETLSVFG